eukprot:NODE_63_length_25098_cov_0.440498.p4 type:complete len:444 gc:universal NODE_63_length_25098_cov_0.440498:5058-3727(-)
MFQLDLLPSKLIDEKMIEFLESQGVSIDNIPNKPVSLQCMLFSRSRNLKYHTTWYMHNYPTMEYLQFAKTNAKPAQEAISYWYKLETPCDIELIPVVLGIMMDLNRMPIAYNPHISLWHMYCFIDQMIQFDGFHPINQLYCVECLVFWAQSHTNEVNIVVHDKRAIILQWLLKSECYEWKKKYLLEWIGFNRNNSYPLVLDNVLLDNSWDAEQQLTALSLSKSVTHYQILVLLKMLCSDLLSSEDSLNELLSLISKSVPCDKFIAIDLIQLYASLLEAGLSVLDNVDSTHDLLNWISILVYCGSSWNALKAEQLDMLNQFILLALKKSEDLLIRIRLLSFPLTKLKNSHIEDLHSFYNDISETKEYKLLNSCFLQHKEIDLSVDEINYVSAKLLDLQLRTCTEDYNQILIHIDDSLHPLELQRATGMVVGTIKGKVIAQLITE